MKKLHPIKIQPKLVTIPLPLNDSSVNKVKSRSIIRGAFNTIKVDNITKKTIVPITLTKPKIIISTPLNNTKYKTVQKKLEQVNEINNEKLNKTQIKEEKKAEKPEEPTKLTITQNLIEALNMTNDDENDSVLMDSQQSSVSIPHSPKIGVQENHHPKYKRQSVIKQSPFSEMVDKRISEYLGNSGHVLGKDMMSKSLTIIGIESDISSKEKPLKELEGSLGRTTVSLHRKNKSKQGNGGVSQSPINGLKCKFADMSIVQIDESIDD